jgi:hypothetical protein
MDRKKKGLTDYLRLHQRLRNVHAETFSNFISPAFCPHSALRTTSNLRSNQRLMIKFGVLKKNTVFSVSEGCD